MEGYWTFSDEELAWENECFERKDEAIKEGYISYPNGFCLGQIKRSNSGWVVSAKTVQYIKNEEKKVKL